MFSVILVGRRKGGKEGREQEGRKEGKETEGGMDGKGSRRCWVAVSMSPGLDE